MKNEMTNEVVSYKCNWCGELYTKESDADECAFIHAKENYATSLLKEGATLKMIKRECRFSWALTKEQEKITKDSCFAMPSWQCCELPAYKIINIDGRGNLQLWGKGSWSGYLGDYITFTELPTAHDEKEHFVDPR